MANQIANILGIQPSGMGLYDYTYSLPNYNKLLAGGLTEAQIANLDPRFSTFNQFPYKAKPNPQQNFAQYEVVPQVGNQTPNQPDNTAPDTEVDINYSEVSGNTGNDVISTRYGNFNQDDRYNTETLSSVDLSTVPYNQMTEQELVDFGMSKGYLDENMRLVGPQVAGQGMNFASPGMMLAANALNAPIQALNDRQYNNFISALSGKGMYSEGGPGEISMASFSPRFRLMKQKSDFYNNKRINAFKNAGASDMDIQNFIGTKKVKIPGTAKFVNSLVNQYAPSGDKFNETIYHTSGGGHYRNDGKFVTGYGQVVSRGSLQDAVDTITAAAVSGNVSTVPKRFLTDKYKDTIKKLIKRGDFTQSEGNNIIKAIDTINSDGKKTKTKTKTKVTPKVGGNDGMSRSDNQPTTGGGTVVIGKVGSKTVSPRDRDAIYRRL